MAERHTKAEGMDLEFLEAQSVGLLPDRLEMHRRRRHHHHHRRRGRRITNTFVLVIEDEGSQFNNGIYNWPLST